jgi:hypothetical protein
MSVKLIRGARGAVYLILIVGLILFVILLHFWLARLLPSCFVRDDARDLTRAITPRRVFTHQISTKAVTFMFCQRGNTNTLIVRNNAMVVAAPSVVGCLRVSHHAGDDVRCRSLQYFYLHEIACQLSFTVISDTLE